MKKHNEALRGVLFFRIREKKTFKSNLVLAVIRVLDSKGLCDGFEPKGILAGKCGSRRHSTMSRLSVIVWVNVVLSRIVVDVD